MDELIKAVKDMRRAQKDFFKTKDYKVLQESKRLENIVDIIIENI